VDSEVEIGTVGDVHLSDKAPSQCYDTYNDDLFGLLDEIIKIATERNLKALVLSGDIFHIKRPDRTSHKTVQRMIDVIHASPCPVYGVIGNHDIQHDRIDSVFETQPFGVLLQAGMRLLDGWAEDLPLYGVPWQQDWQDASAAFQDWRASRTPWSESGGLIVTHAPLYPVGRELPYENIPAGTVAEWAGHKGHLYYGHVHDYHGVFEVDGVTFCNQGALSRGSLHESDLTRKPAITIWHSGVEGAAAFERVELQTAKPGSEVFRVEQHAAIVDYQQRMDQFLAAVGASTVMASSIESVVEAVREMGLPKAEQDLATELLVSAANGELS